MRRRRFVFGLLSIPALVPGLPALRAQQPSRLRRVAVLMLYAEKDPEGQARARAFRAGLEKLGWVLGKTIAIDFLWGVFDPDWTRFVTSQLQQLAPDVIAVNSSTGLRAIEKVAGATPIVFIGVSEPVAQGFVASLAHPDGNLTGFSNLEPTLGAKWVGLLKEVAPAVRRIAFIYNPGNPGGMVTRESAQVAAMDFSLEFLDKPVAGLADIESAIADLAREPNGALILPPEPLTNTHRKRIVELASARKFPIVSALRAMAEEGGLISYGTDIPNLFRQSAEYVDRILKGEKPADMPVQQPTKFEMIVNLRSAKALDIVVPATILARADEVME
jgi:putative tryptophan/tyrosine transport system substrate-binding protein